jgi:hypothetical protein
MKAKNMRVGLVEEFIMNYSALPPAFAGWRRYRIEYGGHAQECLREETIYLPPWVDPDRIEAILNEPLREWCLGGEPIMNYVEDHGIGMTVREGTMACEHGQTQRHKI